MFHTIKRRKENIKKRKMKPPPRYASGRGVERSLNKRENERRKRNY